MASSKIILDKRHRGKADTYPFAFRISHQSKALTIPIGPRIRTSDWSKDTELDNKTLLCRCNYPQKTNVKKQT